MSLFQFIYPIAVDYGFDSLPAMLQMKSLYPSTWGKFLKSKGSYLIELNAEKVMARLVPLHRQGGDVACE